jgi:hypothetical protein
MNDAYFLKHLSKDPKLNIPNIDDENIIIYLPKKEAVCTKILIIKEEAKNL